jgi:signal transduction histidine kinase
VAAPFGWSADSVTHSLEELLRQARRLRFSDAATEARYEEDRFASAMVRERVTMAACALASAVLGLWEAHRSLGLYAFPGLMMRLHVVRFYAVIPLWVALCVATFWRGFPRWAGTANAVVTVLSCWGHSFIAWDVLRAFPARNLAGMLTGSTLLVLIVALLMLPMRFRALVGVVVLSLGGTLWFFQATLGGEPVHAANLATADFSLPLLAVLIFIGGWFREAADRRMFAQREHARRLAEELAAANAELARLNVEKNEFMAIAAHDLRAPLATVRGFAELLRDGRLREEDKRATAVSEIHAQATRMLGLVTDYLGAHAAENAALPVRRERIDLVAHARAACGRHEPSAAGKQQAIAGPEGEPPVWAHADPGLLAQVTDNFISNAVKFSPRGASIRLEVGRRDGVASLAVVDTGPGIPAEEQAGLFRKFGRTSTRPTGGEPSHGLGLALAKRLAGAMGGKVGCESPVTEREPGEAKRGARFWIELPAVE